MLRLFQSLAVLAAVAAAVAAGPVLASPDRAGANPQGFANGSLVTTADRAGAILSADGLVPGDGRSGRVRIVNAGSLAGAYVLEAHTSGSRALARALQLTVHMHRDGAPRSLLYRGLLAGLGQLDLGTFGAGEAHTFHFRVVLPPGAGNDLQGAAARTAFVWHATAA